MTWLSGGILRELWEVIVIGLMLCYNVLKHIYVTNCHERLNRITVRVKNNNIIEITFFFLSVHLS